MYLDEVIFNCDNLIIVTEPTQSNGIRSKCSTWIIMQKRCRSSLYQGSPNHVLLTQHKFNLARPSHFLLDEKKFRCNILRWAGRKVSELKARSQVHLRMKLSRVSSINSWDCILGQLAQHRSSHIRHTSTVIYILVPKELCVDLVLLYGWSHPSMLVFFSILFVSVVVVFFHRYI